MLRARRPWRPTIDVEGWNSFWYTFIELHYRPGYFDNREARDGTPVERVGLFGLELIVRSDPRRVVVGSFETTYQQRFNGLRGEGELNVDLNLLGSLQLRLGATGAIDRGEPRWIGTELDTSQFARLYAHALGFISRVNYTITPKLELQFYAQLLGVGTVFNEGFTAPVGVDRVRLDELVPDPSFVYEGETEALLVGNLFLRWEYAPGSNLYLVATRNQLDPFDAQGDGGLDYGSVGRTPIAYTFLVKATTLFGW